MNFVFSSGGAFLAEVGEMPWLLYRLLFPLAFVLALPFYALRMIRRERGRRSQAKPEGYQVGLGERFGCYADRVRAWLAEGARPIWLSSISVGETLIALKLARAVRAREPEGRVVISVTTTTGYELLLRDAAKLPWILPLYNPVDFRFATRRAVRTIRPRALVLIEGGLWPNLLSIARAEGVPIGLASARLSPRSERRWRKKPGLARAVWGVFDLVVVSEPADVARFESIGVAPGRARAAGNIKFDNATAELPSREAEFRALVQPLGFGGPIIVAGSTWAPEEGVLARALGVLRTEWPDLRLIVVPRHVERATEVEQALAPLRGVRRSQLAGAGPADVLLVDTTGELRDWYRLATVVFVGKTLPGVAEIGGQNMGEPAALGLPVVFGPHTENFPSLVEHLKQSEAAVPIATAEELEPALRGLLTDPARRAAMGEKARGVLQAHQGASSRTAEMVCGLGKK